MDPEIEELKEELKKQSALLQDTNRVVHKLRRNIWWGRIWTLVWWLIVFLAAGGAYYYYAQPYVTRIENYYAGFQQNATKASNFEQQVTQWFSQFGSTSSSTAH